MKIQVYIKEINQQFSTGIATEHTHRPALQKLLEAELPKVRVINEPKQIECGAPDFVLTRKNVPLGYVEAKNIDKNLSNQAYQEQLKRYTESLDNLLFTNYLEFRLIRDGKQVSMVTIGEISNGKIKSKPKNFADFEDLLERFIRYQGQTITTANDLAKHMARKARLLAETITQALNQDEEQVDQDDLFEERNSALKNQLAAFKKYLIHDLEAEAFADVYAQTVAYGMFAARLHDTSTHTFNRQKAADLIPATNPFLRKFFQHIAGYDLDGRIRWIVDELVNVFRATDVGELMEDYGEATQQNDPFLHFYETFLGQYNPKLRKSRGVYYTPEPVVNFIVHAVDDILRSEFNLDDGLADTSKTTIEIDRQPPDGKQKKGAVEKYKKEIHKVQILDPATGTGTFLAAVVQHIRDSKFANQKGAWPGYVAEHLIPRLSGFEVLMAPYVMAHTKLDMTMRGKDCQLANRRLRIFLTNSLEEYRTDTGAIIVDYLVAEAKAANRIKRDTPVMVVIGNPPYSAISSNMGEWITDLIKDYKYIDNEHFGEKKHWLQDDYVKFIRCGQYYIDRVSEGVLAYINNHSFLDNPTFRGMRWNLLQSFDKIYILDLHGNSKKKETASDGSVDENVFDIQQGVSINLFVKTGKKIKGKLAQVFHQDLYGKREEKYFFLNEFLKKKNLEQLNFKELKPNAPQFFFVPKNWKNKNEYDKGFSIPGLFPNNSTGIFTLGDSFAISFSKKTVTKRIMDFLNTNYSEQELKDKYSLGKNYARWVIQNKTKINFKEKDVVPIAYRPFDSRWTAYNGRLIWRWRNKTMQHFIGRKNVGLTIGRQGQVVGDISWCLVFITADITDLNSYYRGGNVVCPLYIYSEDDNIEKKINRKPNLNSDIVKSIAKQLGLTFTYEVEKNPNTFAPIDLLDYIYAVLHSPAYRERYREFLKIDFPRVPYPTDKVLFRKLVKLGGELRGLHLMQSPALNKLITGYPKTGDNIVTKPKYLITDTKKCTGKVKINDTQYFSDVPETAWNFYIGGYQPAQKWLKDRKNIPLNSDNIRHYQKIIVALTETERLMQEIDIIRGG